MSKRFRPCSVNQDYLLPPSLDDWLPEDHLSRFIGEISETLDLTEIYRAYERKDGRGLAAYHPLMLTRLLLYGYSIGVRSSRRIERGTYDDLAFRYLAANQHPDHDTIANFRRTHFAALANLFVQGLQLCRRSGLVKLGVVALDGTKILANASGLRSMKYQAMEEAERRLAAQVAALLADAEQCDTAEDGYCQLKPFCNEFGLIVEFEFEIVRPPLALAKSGMTANARADDCLTSISGGPLGTDSG